MATPDRVSISLGSTVSANYNSVRVEVGMSSDLQGQETPEQALTRIEKICSKRLVNAAKRLQEKLDH